MAEETTTAEEITGGTVTFTIDVPSRRIEELKQLLEGLDVRLDPKRQGHRLRRGHDVPIRRHGNHLPGLVEGMNPMPGLREADAPNTGRP